MCLCTVYTRVFASIFSQKAQEERTTDDQGALTRNLKRTFFFVLLDVPVTQREPKKLRYQR